MASKFLYVCSIQFFVIQFVFNATALPVSSDGNPGNPKNLPIFTIDIETCTCVSDNSNCEVIVVTSVRKCLENQYFCCSATKTTQKTVTVDQTNVNVTDNSTADSSIRIKIVEPTAPVPAPVYKPAFLHKHKSKEDYAVKSKPYCRCKLREKCEEIHTDYSFGFHCSYDKVRCCEPTDNNFTMQGRNDDQEEDPAHDQDLDHDHDQNRTNDNDQNQDQAQSQNYNQTQGSEKQMEDHPSNKKRIMTVLIKEINVPEETKENCSGLPDSLCHPVQGRPVQIPIMKIPTGQHFRPIVEILTPTVSPPQLLKHYHNTPPASGSGPVYYSPYKIVDAKNPVKNYGFIPNAPQKDKYGNLFLANANGRGYYEMAKSPPPSRTTSFLGNFARILG